MGISSFPTAVFVSVRCPCKFSVRRPSLKICRGSRPVVFPVSSFFVTFLCSYSSLICSWHIAPKQVSRPQFNERDALCSHHLHICFSLDQYLAPDRCPGLATYSLLQKRCGTSFPPVRSASMNSLSHPWMLAWTQAAASCLNFLTASRVLFTSMCPPLLSIPLCFLYVPLLLTALSASRFHHAFRLHLRWG